MSPSYNSMTYCKLPGRKVCKHMGNKNNLLKLCNSIAKLNLRLPLYKVDMSKDNLDYAIAVKEHALALLERLERMSAVESESFQSKAISVSDEKILSAELVGQDIDELTGDLTLRVEALASPQLNRGKVLFHSSHWLEPGTYEFKAVIIDRIYPLVFTVKERMNNRKALQSMAEFLNVSLPDINVTVDTVKPDHSCIVIMSEFTGRYGERTFFFEDKESYREGVVSLFGLNRIEKAAQNAKFFVNGIRKQTATNAFVLENVLHITLHKISQVPVKLQLVPDSNKFLNMMNETMQVYNGLIALAENRNDESVKDYGALKLIKEFDGFKKIYSDELKMCGIEFMENAMLRYDERAATEAVLDGSMNDLFVKENGFICRLIDKVQVISINPFEYLDKTILIYPNKEKVFYKNPYLISIYSGLIFNSYC
jgi:flagellar hook-associated protein 2